MNPVGGEAFPASLLLVGAGRMGSALLQAWLDQGFEAARIHVLDPEPSPKARALCQARGIKLSLPSEPPAVLVLAVKPQVLDAVAPALQSVTAQATLIMSVLAGKTIKNIGERLPKAHAIVRAMPNLAAAVGAGMTGAVANAAATAAQKRVADALLACVGRVEWLADEALIDALTAVSGSGPAYVFYLAECLTRAGIEAGLPADLAARLARATIEGSGVLLSQMADVSPEELRENVTSPGGTTAAALNILMADGTFEKLIEKAVRAAKMRAEELSG